MDYTKFIKNSGSEYDILLGDNGSANLYCIDGRFAYCGEVLDYASLPSDAQEGDVYYVQSLTAKYFYNDGAWEAMGDTSVTVPIDSALSSTSTNPVQNKVITNKITDLETADTNLDTRVTTIETAATTTPYYISSTWSDSTRALEFTKTDSTKVTHTIPEGDTVKTCYTSSTWDETNRNLTLTKVDGTTTTHNIKASSSSSGVLTFVTSDGTTVTKRVLSDDATPYALYFELSDGTMITKTIVEETTG